MKVVINKCYGGFSLSAKATKRYAELKGKECYFFSLFGSRDGGYSQLTEDEATVKGHFICYTVPNPQDYGLSKRGENGLYTEANARSREISIAVKDRTDPDLIQVVEELGKDANVQYSKLEVVEIPDGVDFEIHDYDGMESIHERHRTWG